MSQYLNSEVISKSFIMRLVLVNPHTQNFGKSVSGVLLRRKDFMKYDYFIEFFIQDKKKDVAFLIDGTRTSFSGVGLAAIFSWKLFSWLELVIWMLINKINPFDIEVYFDVTGLDPKNDVLFEFSRSIVDIDSQEKLQLNRFEGLKIVHFTHYFKDVKKLAQYLKKAQNYIVIAENNLTNNVFFKKYFSFINNVYFLPFAYGKRFVVEKDFSLRMNKCLALGSITRVKNKEFLDHFGDQEGLHPMRKLIYSDPKKYVNEIDCLIRGFNDTMTVRDLQSVDSFLARIMKRFLPFFLLEKFFPTPQISYFKFDIVAKFNDYRMFLCSEESVGLPSINVFEGMATGCVYVGIDDPMYTALGIQPGVHYIGYQENNIDDLLQKIQFYQNNPDLLQDIARAGCAFVQETFSRKTVADVFWCDLIKISQNFSKIKSTDFVCSFERKY
jgi:glycosyltransferase involved in cell wall biosynthesis